MIPTEGAMGKSMALFLGAEIVDLKSDIEKNPGAGQLRRHCIYSRSTVMIPGGS